MQAFEFDELDAALALCSNGSDSIAFGGQSKEATIQRIEMAEDGQVTMDKSEM